MKISSRLLLSFGLTVLFIIVMAGYGAWQMNHLADLTEKMYKHPLTVSSAVRDVNINVIKIHRHMKDVTLAQNEAQLDKAVALVDKYEALAQQKFKIIKERFLGNQQDVDDLIETFVAWKPMRDEVIALTRTGKHVEAATITKERGAKHVQLLEKQMQALIDFASKKADTFMTNAENQEKIAYQWLLVVIVIVTIASLWIAITTSRLINHSLKQAINIADAIAKGDLSEQMIVSRQDEIGQLFQALKTMLQNLRAANMEREEQNWLKTGLAELNQKISGEQQVVPLAENIINFLTPYVAAQVGVVYVLEGQGEGSTLKMVASHAYTWRNKVSNRFKLGEGLVGQAALEHKPIMIMDLPQDYIHIQSGLGESPPRTVFIIPFMYETQVKGVIELASLHELNAIQREFLKQAVTSIGIAMNTAESRSQMQELLEQSKAQTEELQAQQEELQAQQEELRQANEELEVRSRQLEHRTA